jgi:predicted RNase H-like HicB family nuclease
MMARILYRGEDGFWVAECPSLPGCVRQGHDRDSALQNVREVIRAYVKALEEDQLPVPPENSEVEVVRV